MTFLFFLAVYAAVFALILRSMILDQVKHRRLFEEKEILMTLTRKVTVDQPVDYRIATLVHFVRKLESIGKLKFTEALTDEQLVELADDFWESQHGED